jgi:hypothetical protein
VVWTIDFQFDSAIDGKVVKIPSMVDEHTRFSLLNIVERSITAKRLVTKLEKVFRRSGRAHRRCCGWKTDRSCFPSAATVLRRKESVSITFRPVRHGTTGTSNRLNNRLRKECLICDYWNTMVEA